MSSLRDLEQRFVERFAPIVTVRRNARWSNVFFAVVVVIGLAHYVASPNALAEGDVGGDFRGFYHAGELARLGQASHLYDRLEEIFRGGAVETPFMHPPLVALLFAPFTLISYGKALVVFWALSVALWLGACAIAERELKDAAPSRELWMIVRFAPLAYSLAYGQMTALLAVPLVLFVVSLRRSRDLGAGFWLGLLAIKPQIVAGFVAYLVLQRRFRAVITTAIVGGLVSGASFFVFPEAARHYAHLSARMFQWTRLASARPWAQIGFFRLGTNTFDAISPTLGTVTGAAFALLAFAWLLSISARRHAVASREWDLSLAAIVPLSLCLSPYLFHYDAGLLAIAFMLVQHRLRREPLERDRTYFTDARVSVAFFAVGLFLAIGPGLTEHVQNLVGASFGLQPATLAIAYAAWAVERTVARDPNRHTGARDAA